METFKSKRAILVIGALGAGKSTIMSTLSDGEGFRSSPSTHGVTRNFTSIESKTLNAKLIDSPGLADETLPIS